MNEMNPLDNFHVVLVEPAISVNVGSVARAMMNLGFRHLHLVAPPQYERERALITARDAEQILDTMVIHETFEAAIADSEEVVGFALRPAKNPAHYVTLPEWMGELPARRLHKTALVFGPEDNGLRQEHLNHCRWVIRIPSREEFSAFNLAQSVLLVLYDITKVFPEDGTVRKSPDPDTLPTWNDFFQLDRLLDSVMTETGFGRNGSPGPGPGIIKNLFRRLELDRHEMAILMAFVSRINTALLRQKNVPPIS